MEECIGIRYCVIIKARMAEHILHVAISPITRRQSHDCTASREVLGKHLISLSQVKSKDRNYAYLRKASKH